jgi:uncharacterized protein (UPF0332 family)
MNPETIQYINQANKIIIRADLMLSIGLNEDAARAAYIASFHVAQAYIFERTRKIAKSHHGVQTEFFRLTRDDSRVDPALRRFLSQSYEFKSVADYSTGDEAVTSAHEATDAVATAKSFIAHFRGLAPIPD